MGKIKTFLFFTVLFLGLIALGYTILFAHIERLPLQIWDEAHRGVNAQEILKNNEWIVITFDGKPDLYGTKPPLLVWIQAIFMKLFGMGELAIRLPSALSGLGICLILFFALRKYVKNNWVPAIAVLTLLSSLGFVYIHGVRFGDTDPLLTFFIVLISMNFFRFIHFHKNRYLYFSFLFLALATLTKSIAVFMFVPGLIIYGLYRKELVKLIQNKHFWVGIILFIISVGWYYLIREIKLPGYLKAVWNNEIFGRFFNANDGHRENLRFYIDGLINRRFYFWWILLLSPVTFFSDNKNLKKITFYAVITGLSYLLIISISKTKLAWYDLPLYPAFAVLISGTVYTIISFLSRWRFIKNKFIVDLAFLVILPLLFFQPISKIIDFTFNPKQQSWDQDFYYISYYLRDQVENNKILKNCYVLQPEDLGLSPGIPFHLSHMIFYTNILISRGSNIRFIPKELCKPESQVITNSQPCKKYIDENFESEVVESYKNVEVYNLTRRKN